MDWCSICEVITYQITLYVILKETLNVKFKKAFPLYPCITVFAILFLSSLSFKSEGLYQLFFFAFNLFFYFISPLIFTKEVKKSYVFYTSLLLIGIFSFVNVASSFVTTFINPTPVTTNLTYTIINFVLMFAFCYLSIKQHLSTLFINMFSLSKSVKITTLTFVWELVIFLSLLIVLLTEYPNTPIISLFCFLLIIVLIISFIVFYLLITNNLKSIYYKQLNTTIQNNMNEQVKYYEKISAANENLKKFRHDFNNIKIGLNTYLQANDTTGAINYLNDCNMLIDTESTLFHTGHHIVDALFSDKLQIVHDNNIDISFNGLIPSDVLPPVDLCIIFGNSLDNAIEACLKIENNTHKKIDVSVKQNRDYVFITFNNPTLENVIIKNNTILTTKKDNEMHGIGLYSIKQVLKKYDGHLSLSCNNNIFTTEIDFCIPNK